MRLDVSDVLLSPEFMDLFTLTRQINLHTGGGDYDNHTETKTVRGVITQVDGVTSKLVEDGKIIHGSIRVHTTERLTAGFGIRDNDIVGYNGRKYKVTAIGDYSRYGRGFTDAYCELIGEDDDECECN